MPAPRGQTAFVEFDLGPEVAVELPGGTLRIAWRGPGQPLWMAGPAAFVFEGEFHA